MEEEHQKLHRRGELVKFGALVVILLLTVLVIAGLRPLIFDHLVPAIMGWDSEPSEPAAGPPEPEPTSQEATLSPTLTATPQAESAPDEEEVVAPESQPTTAPAPEPSSTPLTYAVQRGDTLTDIAESFGVTVDAIVQANGIANPDRIQPGDILIIPTP